jgi:DNA-binding MarR family transcriptional regulator
MSKVVGRLEEAGLIERHEVGGDRRRVGLHVTKAGLNVLRSVRSKRTAWLAARLRTLDDAQLEALAEAVEPLTLLLEGDGS